MLVSPAIDGDLSESAADLLAGTGTALWLWATCWSRKCSTACAMESPAPGRRCLLVAAAAAAAAAGGGEGGRKGAGEDSGEAKAAEYEVEFESGACCCCDGSSMHAIFRMLQPGAACCTKASTASTVRARRESLDSAAKVGDSTGAETATPVSRLALAVSRPREMHAASSSAWL